ncbi:MAG: NAD(P)-dependent alcohol dehydrogenase [Isosphaeraceae bacterium]|nr:NAD(P)-dependent alcohol dehydrogenase [Isosphaeraceae bacterium]
MRGYRLHAFDGAAGLRLEELPDPVPGPGQAIVHVRACSLNYRDLLVAKGLYNPKLMLPIVPLSDGAGEVVAVADGVSRVRPGDRVAAAFMPGWVEGPPSDAKARSALGGGGAGMLAEHVAIDAEGLVKLPAHLSFEEAATLPCAGVTAWHALITEGALRPGETILTQGTGGVSLFATQFAQFAGARVIITSSRDEKLERALALGATEGINYKTRTDWDARARELTGGVGVDHVVELGGAGTLARSFKAVRTGGRVTLIGVLSGGGEVNPTPALMKNLRVQGIYVGSRAMFEEMNRAISLHQVRPVVDRVFEFGQAAEALSYLESGAHFGKIVVRVS